jgi:hypothetical protein
VLFVRQERVRTLLILRSTLHPPSPIPAVMRLVAPVHCSKCRSLGYARDISTGRPAALAPSRKFPGETSAGLPFGITIITRIWIACMTVRPRTHVSSAHQPMKYEIVGFLHPEALLITGHRPSRWDGPSSFEVKVEKAPIVSAPQRILDVGTGGHAIVVSPECANFK